MIKKGKRIFLDFNLLILMLLIGIFMYWKKQDRIESIQEDQQHSSISSLPNNNIEILTKD